MSGDRPDPKQVEILRRMTPEQRLRAAQNLYWTVRRHKAAFLRSLHPDWSEEELKAEVRRIFALRIKRVDSMPGG